MTHRWSNTKSKINAINAGKEVTPGTGLEKHMKKGCTVFSPDMKNVRITLVEHFNTSLESLQSANHQEGLGCRCCECNKLKKMEDKSIFNQAGNFNYQCLTLYIKVVCSHPTVEIYTLVLLG